MSNKKKDDLLDKSPEQWIEEYNDIMESASLIPSGDVKHNFLEEETVFAPWDNTCFEMTQDNVEASIEKK
tara:strand:+ start:24428 stop:24637 length:210 start_codon:yes stop_codon:yes gene_type:complete